MVACGACRWPLLLLSLSPLALPCASAEATLLEALDAAASEEDATKLMEPHLDDLKKLDVQVVEKVVMRQWWSLARDIVAKSHTQQVDFSFAVRRAVKTLKDEADELLRTLNPKYGVAQQVSPAFQWAQNDTCVFLTIKYTVRWNAPGALEATDVVVNMSKSAFNFTGLGKHSNNKYRYTLALNLFDAIINTSSSWSAASVGKLSVTLRKRWPRKWPRLLANKKAKISNMHVWMEMQEKLDSTLGGMTTIANSPITCSASEKLYCLATDTCKKPTNCTQCPGKPTPQPEAGLCAGVPTEKATIAFRDADMDLHEIGGSVTIHKAKNEFDIDVYQVYFGKDETNKLQGPSGEEMVDLPPIGQATPTGADTSMSIPTNTAIPEGATTLLVFSKNDHGEFATPGFATIVDAVLPKEKPKAVTFKDEDGDKGVVSGTVRIEKPDNMEHVQEFSLYWGKTATRRIASSASISTTVKAATAEHHISRNTKIPEGAAYILAYTKNAHGENPAPAALKIVDSVKPCINATDDDCPQGVAVLAQDPQIHLSVSRAKLEAPSVAFYSLYWGRSDCSKGGQSGAKNGHIKDVAVADAAEVLLEPGVAVPSGTTHVLAFSKNGAGESNHCVSTDFADREKKEL